MTIPVITNVSNVDVVWSIRSFWSRSKCDIFKIEHFDSFQFKTSQKISFLVDSINRIWIQTVLNSIEYSIILVTCNQTARFFQLGILNPSSFYGISNWTLPIILQRSCPYRTTRHVSNQEKRNCQKICVVDDKHD